MTASASDHVAGPRHLPVLSTGLGLGGIEVAGAAGVWFRLADGRRVIDASNTAAPLGHGHPDLVAAVRGASGSPALNEGWVWPGRQQAADGLLENKPGDGVSSTHGAGGLLDYPHYTRPAEFRGLSVPEVLSSGNHEQIRRWRREQALKKTLRNRPDLLETAALSAEDRSYLRALELHPEGAQSKDSV